MIRNEGSEITRYMSGPITFGNILSIRVLEWLVLLVGCKIKGNMSKRIEKFRFNYVHYNLRG